MSNYSRERAAFRLIECELYNYHQTKHELESYRNDLIDSSGNTGVGGPGSGPGDPTSVKVLALNNSIAIREMERRIKAIEHALQILECHPDKGRIKLVKLKYFERELTDQGICMRLNISERTFRRWRTDAVKIIADRLGYKIQ